MSQQNNSDQPEKTYGNCPGGCEYVEEGTLPLSQLRAFKCIKCGRGRLLDESRFKLEDGQIVVK